MSWVQAQTNAYVAAALRRYAGTDLVHVATVMSAVGETLKDADPEVALRAQVDEQTSGPSREALPR